MHRKSIWIVGTTVLLASAGGVVLAALHDQPTVHLGHVYDTVAVTQGEVRKIVATSGTVRPRMTVQIGSEVSGRIKSIAADFNDKVSSGDLLAEIDPKTFASKVTQAQADLQSAQAALLNTEASVRKARAVLTSAEKVRSRQSVLGSKGFASAAAVDVTERDFNVARAEVELAQAGVASARAMVTQKQAQLDQALIDLERTRIRTPIAGIVLHRAVDVGQTVAASFQAPELFRIAGDLANIHIEAQVSEADIGSVRHGNPVTFDVDSFPGLRFAGRVDQIRLAPAAADSVVTYTVVIAASNAKLELLPGMTANVRIEAARRENVARIAIDAIRFEPPRRQRGTGTEKPTIWDRGKAVIAGFINGEARPSENAQLPVELPAEAPKVNPTTDDMIAMWAQQLQLDTRQVAELKKRVRNLNLGETGAKEEPSRSKRSGRRGRAQESGANRFEVILESLLNPEQRARLDQYRAEQAQTRTATVWVLSPTGEPVRRAVRIGLTDIRFAELVGGELRPGDKVIVRSRRVKTQ